MTINHMEKLSSMHALFSVILHTRTVPLKYVHLFTMHNIGSFSYTIGYNPVRHIYVHSIQVLKSLCTGPVYISRSPRRGIIFHCCSVSHINLYGSL